MQQDGVSWVTVGSGASALWATFPQLFASMKDNTATAANESKTIRRLNGTTWHKYALSSDALLNGKDTRISVGTNKTAYFYAAP
jgi:hypothetical protein